MRFSPLACSGCGWILGNVPLDGSQLNTGTLIFTRDVALCCPQCQLETVWFAPRPAKATRPRRKVAVILIDKLAA